MKSFNCASLYCCHGNNVTDFLKIAKMLSVVLVYFYMKILIFSILYGKESK